MAAYVETAGADNALEMRTESVREEHIRGTHRHSKTTAPSSSDASKGVRLKSRSGRFCQGRHQVVEERQNEAS